MSTRYTPRHETATVAQATAPAKALAVLRIATGLVFLWAFLDKLLGLGYATTTERAWINGGSPTKGFLSGVEVGPFDTTFHAIAGTWWTNWLFMLGLAGIGTALILGVFVNIASASGALMLVMMWTAVLPPENNPFMDDHLIYAGLLGLLALIGAGRYLGLGAMWERMPFVQNSSIFR